MKVAVLGCGPAGLLAAHAADLAGHEVVIYSRKQKSQFGGAQFLHSLIPDITPAAEKLAIHYMKVGSRAGYAEKAYGDAAIKHCSWDIRNGDVPGWDLETAYSRLWERYEGAIHAVPFINEVFLEDLLGDYRMIFSSIPKRLVCRDPGHRFDRTATWVVPDSGMELPPETILYNGLAHVGWHRASKIGALAPQFEYAWPQRNSQMLVKPQGNNCDCWQGTQVVFVGRFGRWERDVLSDSAYTEVAAWLRP